MSIVDEAIQYKAKVDAEKEIEEAKDLENRKRENTDRTFALVQEMFKRDGTPDYENGLVTLDGIKFISYYEDYRRCLFAQCFCPYCGDTGWHRLFSYYDFAELASNQFRIRLEHHYDCSATSTTSDQRHDEPEEKKNKQKSIASCNRFKAIRFCFLWHVFSSRYRQSARITNHDWTNWIAPSANRTLRLMPPNTNYQKQKRRGE